MSMPAPGMPSDFSSVALPSFGGYAAQEGQLQGVSFWPRAGARVIDLIVHYLIAFLAGMLFVIMLVAASAGHVSPFVAAKLRHTGVTGFVFALLGSFAYHVVFTTVHGSTLGKRVLGMVVVQEDSSPCRFKSALLRELTYFVDAMFFGIIGYMAMQKNVQEQRNGDTWAQTVVCKRADLSADKLRGTGTFLMAMMFALMADAAAIMIGFLLAIAG